MDRRLIAAHRLAQEIEWINAKERARRDRLRNKPHYHYDPLAATCLGNLIYSRMVTARKEIGNE